MRDQREALHQLVRAAGDGRLAELCRHHGVEVLTVFGSAADPDLDPGTAPEDLDVAVGFLHGGGSDVVALLDELAELSGSSDIDLLDLGRADPVARSEALVRCEPLYEAAPGAFARAQLRAIQDRLDTAWLRAIELERLAS